MSVGQIPAVRTTNPWSLSTFCEGPRTLNEKITGIVLAILTSIASFFLLPQTGAVVLTGALVVLYLAFCGIGGEGSSLAQSGATMVRAIPNLVNHYVSAPTYVQPILNPAPQPVVIAQPVFAPPRPTVHVAPAGVSMVHVNGQPQAVSNPGPRMVAGTGQIVAPQRAPTYVAPHHEVSQVNANGQPQVVSNPGPRMVAGTGRIVAPHSQPAYVAPHHGVSQVNVNGQPQVVSDPGARMVAGTGQIVAPQRAPAPVVPNIHPQGYPQLQPPVAVNPPPPFHPGDNRPRAVVGRPNT